MASLRAKVRTTLDMSRQGQVNEALETALDLWKAYPKCALVCNLVGDLMMDSRFRWLESEPALAGRNLQNAVVYYERAAENAPDCIQTAAAHGASLLASNLLDQAERELRRGLDIKDPVDPLLHCASAAADGRSMAQRIADAKGRIENDIAYIMVCHEDKHLVKIIRLMQSGKSDVHSVIAAMTKLTSEAPHSVRRKLLYSWIIMELLRSERLYGNNFDQLMNSGLRNMEELHTPYDKSLVIATCYAKYLCVLGQYDAGEKECNRALQIDHPDDPRLHDIPLGSTKGRNYADRVSSLRAQIKHLLVANVLSVEDQLHEMTEEQKGTLLSLRVDDLLEHTVNDHEISTTISNGIQHYKIHSSWVSWICPYHDICGGYETADLEELLKHFSTTIHGWPVLLRLLSCENMPESHDPFHAIYLAEDNEQNEIFCTTKVEYLLQAFIHLVSGSEQCSLEELRARKYTDGAQAINKFLDQMSALDDEDHMAADMMQKLGADVLEGCSLDYRQVLMPLISTAKWDKLKKIMEKQMEDSMIPLPDAILDEPIAEQKGTVIGDSAQSSVAPRSSHQATLCGHGTLHRRCTRVNNVSPSPYARRDQILKEEENYNPYSDENLHRV